MTPEQIKLVRSILERVQEIIEHTYPHDENGERIDDELREPDLTPYEVWDRMCELELDVDEALSEIPETPPVVVEVCTRIMDHAFINNQMIPKYHACISGSEEIWSCGNSVEEAIDDLVRFHSDLFPNGRDGFEVRYLGRLSR